MRLRSMFRLVILVLVAASLVGVGWPEPAPAAAPAPDDPYVAGYAGAVLEREFNVSRRAVTVQNGVLTVDAAQLAGADRTRILTVLAALPGVSRVEVREPAGAGRAGPRPDRRRPLRAAHRAAPGRPPLPAPARRSPLAPLLGRLPLLLRRSRSPARGRGELRRDHPHLPGRRPRGEPVGGGHPGRRVRGVPDGPAVQGPVQRRLLRGPLRRLAQRPGLDAGPGVPPELAPGRRVPAALADRARQPDLRERGPEALLRPTVGVPCLRRRRLPVRPGAGRSPAVVGAGRRRVPQPEDGGLRPHPPGGRASICRAASRMAGTWTSRCAAASSSRTSACSIATCSSWSSTSTATPRTGSSSSAASSTWASARTSTFSPSGMG